ncbi:hypothetical protein DSL92_07365 [Billgrantia gudaonensis]|uniref:Uncharacterized protein n=1 Tax=Billgrantia gudaonensis TaxID=376427 RepID=A0A3S0NDQ8_9GAMM|nr:hypothetical protein DSL92_07365 [Halomonas gudaonensis]
MSIGTCVGGGVSSCCRNWWGFPGTSAALYGAASTAEAVRLGLATASWPAESLMTGLVNWQNIGAAGAVSMAMLSAWSIRAATPIWKGSCSRSWMPSSPARPPQIGREGRRLRPRSARPFSRDIEQGLVSTP